MSREPTFRLDEENGHWFVVYTDGAKREASPVEEVLWKVVSGALEAPTPASPLHNHPVDERYIVSGCPACHAIDPAFATALDEQMAALATPPAASPALTLHTCWDNHEGPDGTHLDGSICRDRPTAYVEATPPAAPEPRSLRRAVGLLVSDLRATQRSNLSLRILDSLSGVEEALAALRSTPPAAPLDRPDLTEELATILERMYFHGEVPETRTFWLGDARSILAALGVGAESSKEAK